MDELWVEPYSIEYLVCVYIYLLIHQILIALKTLILNIVGLHDVTSCNEDAYVNYEQDISAFHLELTPPTVLANSSDSVC